MASKPSAGPIFPRLSSGPRKMRAADVARHQRGRLEGAMVDAVFRHGYWETTLRELVTLAGVSKSTFYEHFASKQDCFLRTLDDILDVVAGRVEEATRSGSLDEKARAGVRVFADLAVEEEPAAYLATVESLALGAAAVPHRERSAERFEAIVRASMEDADTGHDVTDVVIRGIVAGLRNCVYWRMRTKTAAELPALTDTMADWMVGYARPPGEAARRAAATADAWRPPAESDDPQDAEEPDWEEPPDSPRGRRELDQRERIIRAAARIGAEQGYDSLSIPAIASAAAVSNQTFYDHFPGKREAFVAAFDALAAAAVRSAGEALAAELERPGSERPEAIGAGVRALLEHIAADRLFARLAFFELPAAGPEALDHADRTLGAFAAYLQAAPDPKGETALPRAIQDALAGGVWAVIQHEIHAGRGEELPRRAPEIAEFVVTPLGD